MLYYAYHYGIRFTFCDLIWTSIIPKVTPDGFKKLVHDLKLIEFKFEEDTVDPTHPNHKAEMRDIGIDMTAVDRYNDEIKRYRGIVINECRNLPST